MLLLKQSVWSWIGIKKLAFTWITYLRTSSFCLLIISLFTSFEMKVLLLTMVGLCLWHKSLFYLCVSYKGSLYKQQLCFALVLNFNLMCFLNMLFAWWAHFLFIVKITLSHSPVCLNHFTCFTSFVFHSFLSLFPSFVPFDSHSLCQLLHILVFFPPSHDHPLLHFCPLTLSHWKLQLCVCVRERECEGFNHSLRQKADLLSLNVSPLVSLLIPSLWVQTASPPVTDEQRGNPRWDSTGGHSHFPSPLPPTVEPPPPTALHFLCQMLLFDMLIPSFTFF